MIEVDNKYIDSAIDELIHLLGVKECVDGDCLLGMLEEGRTKDCVEAIAHYLGLPISVVLSYVPSVYHGTATPGQGFTSHELVKTDGTGKGVESITAQVSTPDALPLFGSSSLRNYFVTVKVSENIGNYPTTFTALMAHELSHVLLRSLQHSKWDNEVYTDISSMLLGFNDMVKMGRKVVKEDFRGTDTITYTTTYGYLSDSGFSYAYQRINKMLERNRKLKKVIIQKIEHIRALMARLNKSISRFKHYMDLIDMSPRKRISGHDAQQIVSLHQPHYVKKFEDFITASEARLQKYRYYEVIKHYKENWYTGVEDKLDQFAHEAAGFAELLRKEIRVLAKNMNFWLRIRFMFRIALNR